MGVAGRTQCATALVVWLALSGCGGSGGSGAPKEEAKEAPAPVAPDAVVVSWLGWVSRTYPGELSLCSEVAKSALKRLGIQITDEQGGMFERNAEAEARDGTTLVVQMKELSKDSVRISIKVGYLLGDRDASVRILSEIDDELKNRRADVDKRKRLWGGTGSGGSMNGSPPPR